MLKITRGWLVGFTVAIGCFGTDANADALRTVALSGDNAPGTTANFTEFDFRVLLDNAGQTTFTGFLIGSAVDSSNVRGIWTEGSGPLALVARTGDTAPGTGADFSYLDNPLFNRSGQTAFVGGRTGSSTDDQGIWSNANGSLSLVTREGSPAPGTDKNFSGLGGRSGNLVQNDSGQVAFRGVINGEADTNRGIWSEGGGSLALVARTGNAAPGTDVNFSSLDNPVFNNAGQTAFSARIFGSGVDISNDQGIWSEGSGALALAVRTGNEAPGTSVDFSDFSSPVFNSAGQIAFLGNVTGPGVDGNNDRGIWSEGSGSLALVVREGDEVPGTSDTFTFFYPPAFNDAGQTAFSATSKSGGSGNSGIFSERGGTLGLVAGLGDAAPGTNVDFSSFVRLTPALNNAGQVAFLGRLSGADVDSTNDNGIWAEDSLGVLTLIAREGGQLDVSNGLVPDLRTISSLYFITGSGFNDLGQVAFRANFTDGTSGVFVSNLAAVPEPNSLLLLSLVGIGWLGRRK